MKLVGANAIPLEWNRDQMMEIIRKIELQVNLLAEGRIQGRHFTADSVPTTGDFARGDIIWSSVPSAGGTAGWICVAGGSPGTLKAFGSIAA